MYPTCALNGSLRVRNKLQSTSPDKISIAQKLDTDVARKLPNDQCSTTVFRKVFGCRLSHGSSNDLYLRFWMNFSSNFVQTKAPQFVGLEIPDINTSNEFDILGTPTIRIRRPTDRSHWYALDTVFDRETAIRMSAARSYQDYSYKTYFDIWRENQDFGSQNIRRVEHLWTRLLLVQTQQM